MARWAGYSRPDGPLGRLRTGLEAGKDPAADEAGWRLGLPERAWRLGPRGGWGGGGVAGGRGRGGRRKWGDGEPGPRRVPRAWVTSGLGTCYPGRLEWSFQV